MLYQRCISVIQPVSISETRPSHAFLPMLQGVQLPSLDNKAFLLPQTDGNLVLYNQSLVGTYGTTQAAAIWYSGAHSFVHYTFCQSSTPETL